MLDPRSKLARVATGNFFPPGCATRGHGRHFLEDVLVLPIISVPVSLACRSQLPKRLHCEVTLLCAFQRNGSRRRYGQCGLFCGSAERGREWMERAEASKSRTKCKLYDLSFAIDAVVLGTSSPSSHIFFPHIVSLGSQFDAHMFILFRLSHPLPVLILLCASLDSGSQMIVSLPWFQVAHS